MPWHRLYTESETSAADVAAGVAAILTCGIAIVDVKVCRPKWRRKQNHVLRMTSQQIIYTTTTCTTHHSTYDPSQIVGTFLNDMNLI